MLRGSWKKLQVDDFLMIFAMVRCFPIHSLDIASCSCHTILGCRHGLSIRRQHDLAHGNQSYKTRWRLVFHTRWDPAEDNRRQDSICGGADADFNHLDCEELSVNHVLPLDVSSCLIIFNLLWNQNDSYWNSRVLDQNLLTRGIIIYVALGFVVMEILCFGVWCRPFSQYWAIPPENGEFLMCFCYYNAALF